MSDATKFRRRRLVRDLLIPSLLVFGPSVALVVAVQIREPPPSEISAPVEPLLVESEAVNWRPTAPATVSLQWGLPRRVLAPNWSGVLTSVEVQSGVAVVSGDPIVTIDGVERIAFATVVPFWRSLQLGDVGSDVTELQRVLASEGLYDAEIDGRFGEVLQAGVSSWAERIGIETGSKTFDPGWFVWLPVEPFSVETVTVVASEPAPPAGAPLFESPPTLLTAEVSLSGEGSGLGIFDSMALDFVWGTNRVELSGLNAVSADELAVLSESLAPGTETLDGRVELRRPLRMVAVPASAVTASALGRTCVWRAEGTGYQPSEVEVVGGQPGVSYLRIEDLEESALLLANPQRVLADSACP